MTRILLVRHGQTAWNQAGRFRGRADVPLDEVGLAQARAAGKRIAAQWRVSTVYSSPMTRTMQTAQAIAEPFGLSVQPREGLADIDVGQWQGLTRDEVRARWPVELDLWHHAPQRVHFPGGEALAEVRARAMRTVDEVVAQHADETIALVSHEGVNRLILLSVLGLGDERLWHLGQDTCALNVIDAAGGDYTVDRLNDTCHLNTN